jgi:hypothetical protein
MAIFKEMIVTIHISSARTAMFKSSIILRMLVRIRSLTAKNVAEISDAEKTTWIKRRRLKWSWNDRIMWSFLSCISSHILLRYSHGRRDRLWKQKNRTFINFRQAIANTTFKRQNVDGKIRNFKDTGGLDSAGSWQFTVAGFCDYIPFGGHKRRGFILSPDGR